jgi:hypothetical protein
LDAATTTIPTNTTTSDKWVWPQIYVSVHEASESDTSGNSVYEREAYIPKLIKRTKL